MASAARVRSLLLATRNPGKLRELQQLASGLGYVAVDLGTAGVACSPEEETLEVYATFEENALAKARYYHEASGGLPTVADDSGLEVAALGGRPGVHSRRWAEATAAGESTEEANNEKLVRELRGARTRAARFTCVVAYVDRTGERVCRGETTGRIAVAARGLGGFGYDPLFESDDLGGRTFAEVAARAKAAVSHRTRAFAALLEGLSHHA